MDDVQNTQLLTEIRDLQKKKLFWQRIASCAITFVAAVVILSAMILVPKANKALVEVNQAAGDAQTSLSDIDVMVDSITKASENLNTLVEENGETLAEAVKNLSEVDYDGLNKAIVDLQDAVGPMAEFMKKFN